MSSATIQVTAKVDRSVAEKCPSDKVYFSLYSQKCCQSIVTPPNPATADASQVMSAVTYAGCPFNSCCYKDSDIKWDLFYYKDDNTKIKIARIDFHEPWGTSFHSSGVVYYNSDNGGDDANSYDVSVSTPENVDRHTKCEVSIRPKD